MVSETLREVINIHGMFKIQHIKLASDQRFFCKWQVELRHFRDSLTTEIKTGELMNRIFFKAELPNLLISWIGVFSLKNFAF
jgi:hypothetical protein